MTDAYAQDQVFDRINVAHTPLPKGEYEGCTFHNCDFSSVNLTSFVFIDCTFSHCNLSLVKTPKTAFRDVTFKDCKMLGVRFDTCDAFGLSLSFEGCQLNHASFYKTKIKKTIFRNTQLQEVDFVEADLSGATFDQCDLTRAVFEQTILEKVDFRTAQNYVIDPEINKIKKARFSIMGIAGLLTKYDIQIETN